MEKSNLGVIIIVGLVLIGLSFYGGYFMGGKKVASQPQENKTQKVSKLEELLDSRTIQLKVTTNGTVKKILDHSLEIMGFNEKGEETGLLVVPISEKAKVVSHYVLPEGASEEKIIGRFSTPEGEMINIGEKEIDFGEIKMRDSVNIALDLKPDFTIEGTSVWVSPADLLSGE